MSSERIWTDQITVSSFRGVVFEVESATVQFGRRGTIHQFPFKDIPYSEDIGKQAKIFTISAYVDGDNYLARRNELEAAISNHADAGTLILPTIGAVQAKPSADCTVTFNNQQGGIERFTLKFTEAGRNEFPSSTVNTKETVKDRDQTLRDDTKTEAAANMNFEQTLPDSTEGINDPDSFADETIEIVNSFNDAVTQAINTGIQVGDAIDEFSRKFENYQADARSLILTPIDLLNETDSIYDDLRGVYADNDLSEAFSAFRDIFNSPVDDIAKVINLSDPGRRQQDKNNQATRDANRNLLLGQMSQVTVDEEYVSTDQVRNRRTAILELFEQQIENAGLSFDICQRNALVDLRSAVVADLNDKIGTLPDEIVIVLRDTSPAFTQANKLYGDALRGEEIAITNGILNPLLLPSDQPLNVLSA
jgi:prophage DNA circulation protein